MAEWQPIETAPKDGTRVLLICMAIRDPACKDRLGTMAVDYWRKQSRHDFEGWGKFNERYWPATHWQPLPEPPAP